MEMDTKLKQEMTREREINGADKAVAAGENAQEEKPVAAVVWITQTKTTVALVDEDQNVIKPAEFATMADNPEENAKKTASLLLSYGKKIAGIGIAVSGFPDSREGLTRQTDGFGESWAGFPVAKWLEQLCEAPAFLKAEIHLSALGEALTLEERESGDAGTEIRNDGRRRTVLVLNLSGPIESDLIVNGKIYEGAHDLAGCLSDSILEKNGPKLAGFMDGSAQALCSKTGVLARAKAAGLNVQNPGDLILLSQQKNEAAKDILDDAVEYLANLLAILYSVCDPDLIILQGMEGLRAKDDAGKIEALVREKVHPSLRPYVRVQASALDGKAVLKGAGAFVFQELKTNQELKSKKAGKGGR